MTILKALTEDLKTEINFMAFILHPNNPHKIEAVNLLQTGRLGRSNKHW